MCLRICSYFSGPYGPIRALINLYGPIWARRGPLKSGKSIGKALFSLVKHIFIKNRRFRSPYYVFYSFNAFFRFLSEIHFRKIMKSPQKASSRTKTCSFGTSVTLPEVTVCKEEIIHRPLEEHLKIAVVWKQHLHSQQTVT